MSAPRLTALGIERDGTRILTVGGHREGVHLRLAMASVGVNHALTPDEAEHAAALLTEAAANARLKARVEEPA